MTAQEFLIKRRIIINGVDKFPINLSRDCHIHTKNEIIRAMEDYAKLKIDELNNHTEAISKSSYNPKPE